MPSLFALTTQSVDYRKSTPRCQRLKKGELQEAIARSRGGNKCKVHAAVDAHGRPLRLAISGGNVHDSHMMYAFLDWDKPPPAIVADKA